MLVVTRVEQFILIGLNCFFNLSHIIKSNTVSILEVPFVTYWGNQQFEARSIDNFGRSSTYFVTTVYVGIHTQSSEALTQTILYSEASIEEKLRFVSFLYAFFDT